MQSTGHSSMQALSLRSTHGWAITYVMGTEYAVSGHPDGTGCSEARLGMGAHDLVRRGVGRGELVPVDLLPAGAHIVAPADCYFGVGELLADARQQGRWAVDRVDLTDTAAVQAAVTGADLRLFGKPESFLRRRMGVALARAADTDEARKRAADAAARVRPVKA